MRNITRLFSSFAVVITFVLGAYFLPGCSFQSPSKPDELPGYSGPAVIDGSGLSKSNYVRYYAEKSIGPKGGYITVNRTSLYVPPAALAAPTTISILIEDAPNEGLPNSPNRRWTFGPEGLKFRLPVVMTLSYAGSDLKGLVQKLFAVYYLNEGNNLWELIGGVPNILNQTVITTTTHFSRYAVAHSQ